MKTRHLLLLVLFIVSFQLLTAQPNINLIPKPLSLERTKGVFKITSSTMISVSKNLNNKAKQLKNFLEPALGFELPVTNKLTQRNCIELKLEPSTKESGKEGYQLDIKPDKVVLTANDEKGIFWGIQTIRQLLPSQILRGAVVKDISWELPCMLISDKPRFKWRGLMLDCSRTFISKEQIKRYLEVMSYFKMNVLHLHLTDDQGWRLEILKYPELTGICSKFHESFKEPSEFQGYYSQDDMREIIEFAGQRNIEIIPELEMPGHSSEIFAAFPTLSCKGDTSKIHPFFKGPSVHNEILCAGNEATFRFIENILDEVVTLFPSPYVHIGGDEAPKKHWKECPKCQNRIKEEGLKDENELQSWFVKRIEKYLNTKGKKLIGWDEITEGGLSSSATVMYWRGWVKDVPEKVAGLGNNLIMTPTSSCYFDYNYETTSTEKVYSFNPVAVAFGAEKSEKILGVQANFWSHIDRTSSAIDKQLFPRLIALSETAWSSNDNKDWNEFKIRLKTIKKSLDIIGIYYFNEQ